jgi:two-component system, OmpR family, response regulator
MVDTVLRALVIEDSADIRELISETLQLAGFTVATAENGRAGLDLVGDVRPDLVTLDLTLPDLDGIEVCRRLRGQTDAYVVMLTARVEEIDMLLGLEVGADDYMTKPFSPRELRARVAALLRRPRTTAITAAPAAPVPASRTEDEPAGSVYAVGDLSVDVEAREARVDGRLLPLTRTEFDLLATLASNDRRVWDRDTLFRRVWNTDWAGDHHALEVHVANLRRKLGDPTRPDRRIKTVRGIGYRLQPFSDDRS